MFAKLTENNYLCKRFNITTHRNMKRLLMMGMLVTYLMGAQNVNAQDVVTSTQVAQMSAKDLAKAHKVQKDKEKAIKDAEKLRKKAASLEKKAKQLSKKAEDLAKKAEKTQKDAKEAAEKAEKMSQKAVKLSDTMNNM